MSWASRIPENEWHPIRRKLDQSWMHLEAMLDELHCMSSDESLPANVRCVISVVIGEILDRQFLRGEVTQ